MLVSDEKAVYHVMSSTALDGFPLADVEKEFMLGLIKRFAALYFTEILGFCLMGNHFHLLVKMLPDRQFTDSDIKARLEAFHGKERDFADEQIPYWRKKLSNLSEFMREIKVGFSRYYNRRHNRWGYFWGERFKSVIEDAADMCMRSGLSTGRTSCRRG
jgi:putative transposase